MKKIAVLALLFSAKLAFSQAQPVFSIPADNAKVSSAVAQSISQNLRLRGFAANDPRISQTIKSISNRIPTLAAAAGGGSNWIRIAARLSPWVTLGTVVVQGIKWYLDGQGNVIAEGTAISNDGTTIGFSCFYALGAAAGTCFGTPEQAVTHHVISTTVFTSLASINLAPDAAGTTSYSNGRRYTANGQGYRSDQSPTTLFTWPTRFVYVSNATVNCPPGQGQLGGACVPSHIDKYTPPASQPATPAQTAYDALSPSVKTQPISTDLIADLSNRFWREAATQAAFSGVPWSAAQPVTADQAQPFLSSQPQSWPQVQHLNLVPPTVNPVQLAEQNPNSVSQPSSTSTVQIDFGGDPGTPQPTLEETPSDLFQPIKLLMNPFLDWQAPTVNAQCPTWSASPSIAGHVFNINIQSHCPLIDQHRQLIYTLAAAGWACIALFIILSA
jgi:hypothetical protein